MSVTITLIHDTVSGEHFGAILDDGQTKTSIGFSKSASSWANSANTTQVKDLRQALDYSLQSAEPIVLTGKALHGLRSTLPDMAYLRLRRALPETSQIQYGDSHKTMGTRYVSKRVLEQKQGVRGTSNAPLSSFSPSQQKAVLSFKTEFARTQARYANLEFQVKGSRALFDANIGPGGGWRCPDGTLYGGQITDRFGRGCGGGLTRRIGRALLRAGQRLDDIGTARDARRLARRTQAATNRRERRNRMGDAFDAVGDKFEQWAQALVGDYTPSTGGRRRRRGLDGNKITRDVKTPKKRVLSPKAGDKKKGTRKKKGARARLADFSDRISEASERMARRLVGDYKPDKKERKKKGSKRESAEKLDRLAQALERTASRILGGGGRRERRRKDKTPVDRKPLPKKSPTKKPSAKKPTPKKPVKKNDRKSKISNLKTDVNDLNTQISTLDDDINALEAQGIPTADLEKKYKDLVKERDAKLVELANLESLDPTNPAKLPKKKPSGKPSGTPKKNLPGKQHGGAYTKPENAKAKANAISVQEGKPMFVVQDANGKYRVVDEDRLKVDESLQVIFATDQDGGIIELTDIDSPIDEVIEEVTAAAAKVDADAKSHLDDLDVDALDLELKRSKTGAFLPDSFDKDQLDQYSSFADKKFRETFHKERMTNWRFWQNTLGDDKVDGVQDSKTMLALIDKAIADESAKPDASQSVLGVMRAERANFLAMWVPDENKDEVNFYDRINFVQPKRRQAIINDAGLGDLIVGKKKPSKKDKPKKVSPDGKLNPVDDAVPSASDMGKVTPDPDPDPSDPIVTDKKVLKDTLYKKDEESLDDLTNQFKTAASDSNYKAYRSDDGKIDLDKFDEDLKDEGDSIVEDALKIDDRISNGEPVKQSELDQLAERSTRWKARKKVREDLKKQRDDENILAEKANDNTVDTEPVTPDGIPDAPSKADLYKKQSDTIFNDPDAKKESGTKVADGAVKSLDTDWDDPDQIDLQVDNQKAILKNDYDAAKDRLDRALKGEYDYPDGDDPFADANFDDDVNLINGYDEALNIIEAQRDIQRNKLAGKLSKKDSESQKTSALKKMEADAVGEGFDQTKLDSKLVGKLLYESDFDSLLANLSANEKESLIADLPDDFDALSVDDKIAFLKYRAGGTDSAKTYGRLYQSLYNKRFGDKDSRQELNAFLDGYLQRLKTNQQIDYDAISGTLSGARKDLDDLLKLKQGSPDLSTLEKMELDGRIATARNRVIGLDTTLLGTNASPELKTEAYKRLNENLDALPEPMSKLLKAKILSGSDAKIGVRPTAAKNMPTSPHFDPAALGSTGQLGEAISSAVPLGSNGIFSQDDAVVRVASGLPLSQIPDDFLADSIKQNIGDDKRFRMLKIQKGFNGDTTAVFDITTGKKYIIKTEDRNHLGHIQESAAFLLAQELGFGTVGIRYGSPLKDVDLPSAQKSTEKVTTGLGRTMVIEHLENLFPSNYTNPVVSTFHSLPAGAELDGESIARLMVLDRSMNYFDRTPGNLFFVKNKNGKVGAHPIDHGNAFRPWGGSSSEQAVGFVSITKGDNVDLMSLVKQLPEAERKNFARGLIDANKRYQKADFPKLLKGIGDSGPHSQDELDRLTKHADFLESRKTALDWDEMVKVGLSSAGFSGEDIESLTTIPPQYKLPERTGTIGDLGTAISRSREKGRLFSRIAHDGDQIEFSEVRVSEVNFKGLPSMPGGEKSQKSTMLVFRRRGDVQQSDFLNDPEWKKLGSGHIVPKRTSAGNITFNMGLANPHTAPASTNSNKATYYKELPDGSIALITLSSDKKNTADNMVRIIIPDKNKKPADSGRVIEAMKAVGVTDHEPPTPEKIANLAKSNVFTTLTGKKLYGESSPDDALDVALDKWGLTQDDIRLVPSPDGGVDIGFTPEGAKKLASQINTKYGYSHIYHNHATGKASTFASGAMLSTLMRHENGILTSGLSSSADMDQHGSGNWVYFYKGSGSLPGSNSGVYASIMPLDVALLRGDFRAFDFDAWGDIEKYQPLDVGFGSGNHEVDFRSSVSFGRMVTQVPNEAVRQEFIAAAKAKGNDEFGGVPVELLVVVKGDHDAVEKGFKAIREAVGLDI